MLHFFKSYFRIHLFHCRIGEPSFWMLFHVRAIFYRTIPVVVIEPAITVTPEEILLTQRMSKLDIKFSVCFDMKKGKLKRKCSVSFQWVFLIQNNPHDYFNQNSLSVILAEEKLPLHYQIDLDSDVNKKRITADNSDLLKNTFTLTADTECTHIDLQYSVRYFFVWFFFSYTTSSFFKKIKCYKRNRDPAYSYHSKLSEKLSVFIEQQIIHCKINWRAMILSLWYWLIVLFSGVLWLFFTY